MHTIMRTPSKIYEHQRSKIEVLYSYMRNGTLSSSIQAVDAMWQAQRGLPFALFSQFSDKYSPYHHFFRMQPQ